MQYSERTPLHLKLSSMPPEQIVESFPHDLADDLAEQGMSAADVEAAREAAKIVLSLCGVMKTKQNRRKLGVIKRPASLEKLAARQAKREAARAAKAAKMKQAKPIASDGEPALKIEMTPDIARTRRRLGLDDPRHRPTLAHDATSADGTEDTDDTRDDGSEAPRVTLGNVAA